METFVLLLGAMAIFQGLPYLVAPKIVRKRFKKWLKYKDLTYRTYGAIAFAIGIGIIYVGLF